MAADFGPGLALDFLTQPVNVSWGGLAVEFTERLDYLTLNRGLDTNKVTISFWFRVPSESVASVRAQAPPFGPGFSVFIGVLPLITWGQQQRPTVTEAIPIDTGAIDSSAGPIVIYDISGSHTAPMQPSSIGIYCPPDSPLSLDINIQTDVHASGSGLAEIQTDWTGDFAGINQTPPHVGSPIYINVEYIMTDVSQGITDTPETFGNSRISGGVVEVTPDAWHHLLISWDISGDGTGKMWCALDDVNKSGDELPALNDPSMGPNEHQSTTKWQFEERVSVGFGDDDVPSDPFQIPAPLSVERANDDFGGTISIAPIETVELAELQIFSGVVLDTSSVSNRSAFIDLERDEEGNPVRDVHGKGTLKPVNPKQAEELLGRKPDVLLHGSSKWQKGKNTGSIGIDVDGNEIPSGQFTPAGEITKYTPDPSIVEP